MSRVTLSEAKDYLRVDFTEDDVLIQSLIDASEDWVSQYTNHVLTPKTKTLGVGCYEIWDYPISVTSASGTYKVEESSLSSVFRVSSGDVVLSIGYKPTDQVPATLLIAVKKLVVYLYENRDVYPSTLPLDIQVLLNKFRRFILV